MKIEKTEKIAGYNVELSLKSKDGKIIKHFSSVSNVDFHTAQQTCLKRMSYFVARMLLEVNGEKSYLDEYIKERIKDYKITKSEVTELNEKLSKMIIRPVVKIVEL